MSESTTSKPVPTRICVFCGVGYGTSEVYAAAARALAQAFHDNGIQLIYGGGSVGLMGELASALVKLSGPEAVHGIIPRALLVKERKGHVDADQTKAQSTGDLASTTTTPETSSRPTYEPVPAPQESAYGRTTVVSSMHERKQLMTKLVLEGGPGSGFIALPGGFGTLEELAEVTTWNQIGIHEAGIVVCDVEGFWQPLLQWVKHAADQGFIQEKNAGIIATAPDAEGCIKALREYQVSSDRARLDWK